MTSDQSKSPPSQKDQRQQRLAEALRANLHRRKAQSRGRKSATDDARSEDKGKIRMDKLIIEGGNRLEGRIPVSGPECGTAVDGNHTDGGNTHAAR